MPGSVTTFFRSLAVYGAGDVMTSAVSLLLLPLFTRHLSPVDYGVITMLLTIEAVAKVAFRWGIDTAFMRLYFDCPDETARRRLASTVFFFLLAANGSLLVAAVAASDWLAASIIGQAQTGLFVALTLANTFVAGFFFIPYHVLRIGGRAHEFIAITTARSAATVIARLVLVIWAGQGVFGIVLADVVVTLAIALVLVWRFRGLIQPVFSRPQLREALAFGLPRVPHSVAHQVMGFADRYFLSVFATLREVGLYSIGATFGLALKLFLSAFESAWTPFFLSAMRQPDARTIYSTVSTYVVAVLVVLVAGVAAMATDLVRLFTAPEFHEAARVTPWIAVGVLFQGLYLVGSIGLIIAKRTTFYPIATGLAATASIVANLLLLPSYGLLGAAWANIIAYATLATATSLFSWRVYPIQYEWTRLLRIAIAGGVAYLTAATVVPDAVPAWIGLLLRGSATVAAYGLVLAVLGFFHAGELRALRDIRRRVLPRPKGVRAADSTSVEMAGDIVASTPVVEVEPSDAVESRATDFRDRRR